MTGPVGRSRVVEVDALRGFALLGILLVNVWFFADSSTLSGGPDPDTATATTLAVRFLVSTFLEGKFYLLFSLLFGYGLAVSLSAGGDGDDAVRRTVRRLGVLAVLGVVHGVALFYGDILLTYAVMGAVLLAFRPTSAKVALRIAVLITVAVALLLAVSAVVVLLEATTGTAGSGDPAVPTADAATALAANARTYGMVLPSVVVFQGPLALAAFYAGYALASLGILRPGIPAPVVLHRVVLMMLPLGLAGSAVQAYLSTYGTGAAALFATPISVLVSPLVTIGYVATVLLLLGTRRGGRVTRALAPVGRVSLTNYLAQSAVLGLVFTGYGLGLMDRLASPVVVLVVLALFAVQIVTSRLILQRFGTGPVEWVLRRVVYGAQQRSSGPDAG